jgi:hypothetical protein
MSRLIGTFVFLILAISLGPAHAGLVKDIRVAARDYHAVIIEWDRGDPDNKLFEVRYQENGGPWHPLGKTSETSRRLSGLEQGIVYRFKVRVESDDDWAFSADIRTLLDVPASITGLALVPPATDDALTVAWDPAAAGSIVDRYNLQHRIVGEEAWQSAPVIDGGQVGYELAGLKAVSDYELRLNAENTDGASQWALLQARTLLPVPKGLSIKQVDDTSIVITLPVLPDYMVDLSYRVSADPDWQQVEDVAPHEYRITSLEADTPYEVRLRYRYKDGSSDWSQPVRATTDLPPLPAEVAVPIAAKIATRHARILWSPRNNHGVVERYEIQWKQYESEQWVSQLVDDATHVIDGLQPRTEYDVRVRAINRQVKGNWSPQSRFMTLAISPPQLQIESVNTPTPRSVRIIWLPAESQYLTSVEIQQQLPEQKWETAIQKDMDSRRNERVIIGLQANTAYRFRLRAVNFDRQGEWSDVRQVVTSRKPALPKSRKR